MVAGGPGSAIPYGEGMKTVPIDRLETSRLGAPPDLIVDEHWFKPLAAGLILMALALLMGETWWMRLPS